VRGDRHDVAGGLGGGLLGGGGTQRQRLPGLVPADLLGRRPGLRGGLGLGLLVVRGQLLRGVVRRDGVAAGLGDEGSGGGGPDAEDGDRGHRDGQHDRTAAAGPAAGRPGGGAAAGGDGAGFRLRRVLRFRLGIGCRLRFGFQSLEDRGGAVELLLVRGEGLGLVEVVRRLHVLRVVLLGLGVRLFGVQLLLRVGGVPVGVLLGRRVLVGGRVVGRAGVVDGVLLRPVGLRRRRLCVPVPTGPGVHHGSPYPQPRGK